MGYRELSAKNKTLEPFGYRTSFWRWMLEQGVGLAIGVAPCVAQGMYYKPKKKLAAGEKEGANPLEGGSYFVNKSEAKAMASLAKSLAEIEKLRQKEWDEFSQKDKDEIRHLHLANNRAVNPPVRRDWTEELEKFSEWAKKSEGFYIL